MSSPKEKANSPLTAPGPSPWYLGAPQMATLQTSRGPWTWQSNHGNELETLSCLLSPDGMSALQLGMGCYVLPLAEDRLLVWHERRREDVAAAGVDRPGIVCTVLQMNALKPLPAPRATGQKMSSTKHRMAIEGGDPVVFEVPTDLGEGVHAIEPPVTFRDVPEILVLADYGSEASNHFDKMFRAIFAIDFRAGRVVVLPQRWFNEGPYDFSYQWITRVQREPATGRIVGEGIRLGRFQLDASGTQIEAWLDESLRPLDKVP